MEKYLKQRITEILDARENYFKSAYEAVIDILIEMAGDSALDACVHFNCAKDHEKKLQTGEALVINISRAQPANKVQYVYLDVAEMNARATDDFFYFVKPEEIEPTLKKHFAKHHGAGTTLEEAKNKVVDKVAEWIGENTVTDFEICGKIDEALEEFDLILHHSPEHLVVKCLACQREMAKQN